MKPKITLLSWTHNPIETIYLLWEASRKKVNLPSITDLQDTMDFEPALRAEVQDTFLKVLSSHIPVSENINFVFLLENVSVAFREQMVRHRVGVKVGDRIGMDYIPDIHDSTWWSQTMRVIDMGNFYTDEGYHIPESIENDPVALQTYKNTLYFIQLAYNELVKKSIPPEDARMVIPMAAQHRISWGMNLSTLAHIVSKRSCWIAQLGLWEPVIMGMLKEVCEKVDPIFSILATPPCMKGDEFVGCLHELDAGKRVTGEDPSIPCALYCSKRYPEGSKVLQDIRVKENFQDMCLKYIKFWRRDVNTGKALV
jgi:hypothetical protein